MQSANSSYLTKTIDTYGLASILELNDLNEEEVLDILISWFEENGEEFILPPIPVDAHGQTSDK